MRATQVVSATVEVWKRAALCCAIVATPWRCACEVCLYEFFVLHRVYFLNDASNSVRMLCCTAIYKYNTKYTTLGAGKPSRLNRRGAKHSERLIDVLNARYSVGRAMPRLGCAIGVRVWMSTVSTMRRLLGVRRATVRSGRWTLLVRVRRTAVRPWRGTLLVMRRTAVRPWRWALLVMRRTAIRPWRWALLWISRSAAVRPLRRGVRVV